MWQRKLHGVMPWAVTSSSPNPSRRPGLLRRYVSWGYVCPLCSYRQGSCLGHHTERDHEGAGGVYCSHHLRRGSPDNQPRGQHDSGYCSMLGGEAGICSRCACSNGQRQQSHEYPFGGAGHSTPHMGRVAHASPMWCTQLPWSASLVHPCCRLRSESARLWLWSPPASGWSPPRRHP